MGVHVRTPGRVCGTRPSACPGRAPDGDYRPTHACPHHVDAPAGVLAGARSGSTAASKKRPPAKRTTANRRPAAKKKTLRLRPLAASQRQLEPARPRRRRARPLGRPPRRGRTARPRAPQGRGRPGRAGPGDRAGRGRLEQRHRPGRRGRGRRRPLDHRLAGHGAAGGAVLRRAPAAAPRPRAPSPAGGWPSAGCAHDRRVSSASHRSSATAAIRSTASPGSGGLLGWAVGTPLERRRRRRSSPSSCWPCWPSSACWSSRPPRCTRSPSGCASSPTACSAGTTYDDEDYDDEEEDEPEEPRPGGRCRRKSLSEDLLTTGPIDHGAMAAGRRGDASPPSRSTPSSARPLRPPVVDRTAPPEDLPPITEPEQLTIQPVEGNYVLPVADRCCARATRRGPGPRPTTSPSRRSPASSSSSTSTRPSPASPAARRSPATRSSSAPRSRSRRSPR